MDKTLKAHAVGEQMYSDPWLAHEIKDAAGILRANGKSGLRLAARELLKDDHFEMNWWPQLVQLGGSESAAKELLRSVIDGFVDALMTAQGLEADEPRVQHQRANVRF